MASQPSIAQTVQPKRSNKAPAVKAAIIAKRANGEAKRKIARDLGISSPTVDVIIKEANIDQQIASGKLLCAPLIPKAVTAIETQLGKGDGELGRKFLNDMGVIGANAKPAGEQQINAFSNCQVLIQQALGNKAVPANTPDAQVIESKPDTALANIT